MKMYEYLHKTNEPYDECLDWAVLFHDIVYDNQPEKEYRSAVMFSDMKEKYSGCDLNALDEGHVAALIMATENHSVAYSGYSPIIRADLHGLTSPIDTFYNFQFIMGESMNLYNINEVTFADNSIKFLANVLLHKLNLFVFVCLALGFHSFAFSFAAMCTLFFKILDELNIIFKTT